MKVIKLLDRRHFLLGWLISALLIASSATIAQEPIAITPGTTTISSPGLKVYTTYLGLPCGDAFPMPGCLPPEYQGWLVQIEGGDEQFFDVAFTWTDAEGKEHTAEANRVPRAAPYHGKPSFTAVPFPVGRAKSTFFPVGTVAVRTVVSHYTPKIAASVEHEQR